MKIRNLRLRGAVVLAMMTTVAGVGCATSDATKVEVHVEAAEAAKVADATEVTEATEVTYPTGTYNFKFADSQTRHAFMAAAEEYLLTTQTGGIPLFTSDVYGLYSSRVQLPVDEYVPVMEFGDLSDITFAADDSTVLMEDGKPGKEGEYTYRIVYSSNPQTWNQWLYASFIDADYMVNYLDSLYKFEFNADKTSYELNPSMAAGAPIPINSKTLASGKEIAKTWQIKIKDLEWVFNEDTDMSMVKDTKINAIDVYDTFKLALENQWLRAVSGGGDFCSTEYGILNAQEFADGMVAWEEVGIKLIDANTLELTYVEEQSEWNVKYALSSFALSPIHTEMYAALGDQYGTNEVTTAYHGPFYPDYYESDKVVRMKKNEKFHSADKYMATGQTITIIADAEMAFEEFKVGKLDYRSLPATQYDEFKNHPGLKTTPGSAVYRVAINGFGTQEEQLKTFPDVTWMPEPILANADFKKAMYLVVDRNKLAKDIMKTVEPSMYLFPRAYFVEPEEGVPFRDTEWGKEVGKTLSPSSHGYNLDAAKALFEKALDTLVADGVYKNGDEIKIEFYFFSGSETQALLGDYFKTAFEEAFYSEKYDIKVTVDTMAKEIYANYFSTGEFDLALAALGGSKLNAASHLNVFTDDDRAGYTLNWGINTSDANIPVTYVEEDGEVVTQMWSFNAISSVLNAETEIFEGTEIRK
ncbi:ABC transporter substrate-binding protein [Candidatus Epulonipiscium viviparus]|uniref:ABC transporter substrate-binding protein n=1 Tax=Candidatus Epulonipiscium viviparus TaxID=420336 RepID=UPI0027380567|nr:ABC transporter substrate-binding protein [Candidatus Epulopiscium viviparus]